MVSLINPAMRRRVRMGADERAKSRHFPDFEIFVRPGPAILAVWPRRTGVSAAAAVASKPGGERRAACGHRMR